MKKSNEYSANRGIVVINIVYMTAVYIFTKLMFPSPASLFSGHTFVNATTS